jgi:hypothetical protein
LVLACLSSARKVALSFILTTILGLLKRLAVMLPSVLVISTSVNLVPSVSLAWGHMNYLSESNSTWRELYLVFPVLKRKKIQYCLNIDTSAQEEFQAGSVATQLEAAIQLWLAPVRRARLIDQVEIKQVGCGDGTHDLMVVIGPEFQYPKLGAYQMEVGPDGRPVTMIKIDSSGEFAGRKIRDIKNLLISKNVKLASMLKEVATIPGLSLNAFSNLYAIDQTSVGWSTIRLLVHELGHSFGLCDTRPDQLERCDTKFLTNKMDSTVMSDVTFLSLAPDDEAGIVALFRRFKK